MLFASSHDHNVDYAGFYFNAFAFGGNGDGNGVYTSTYDGVTTSWNEDGSPITTGDSTGGVPKGAWHLRDWHLRDCPSWHMRDCPRWHLRDCPWHLRECREFVLMF